MTAVFLLLMGPSASPHALAQEYGRWWWEAQVGLGGRQYDVQVDGLERSLGQDDLHLSLGINGFLLDPALGRFRLLTDFHLSRIEGSSQYESSDRIGLKADFFVLPRSTNPTELFFHHTIFDFATVEESDSLALRGIPDSTTRWGGSTRLLRGFLKGTTLGIESATTELVYPERGSEASDLQYVDWSRLGDRFQHRAHLEHRRQAFGTVAVELDDLVLRLDEAGELGAAWGWQLNGTALQRGVALPDGPTVDTANYQIRNRLSRSIGERHLLDLNQLIGLFEAGSTTYDTETLVVTYRHRLRQSFEVAPFAEYTRQGTDVAVLDSSGAGVGITWTPDLERISALLTSRLSYWRGERHNGGEPQDLSRLAFSVSGAVGHGRPSVLRKELEVEFGRNELEIDVDPLLVDSALGLLAGGNRRDLLRGRLTLAHSGRLGSLNAYAERRDERAAAALPGQGFESETLSVNLNYAVSFLSLDFTGGEMEVDEPVFGKQFIDSTSASIRLSPWRSLRLNGSWRQDTRSFPLVAQLAELEGERYEVGLEYQLGSIIINGRFFEESRMTSNGRVTENRGVIWSVRRGLAGWLPIVTAVERRGVIR